MTRLSRRQWLSGLGALALATALPRPGRRSPRAAGLAGEGDGPRFLIVIGGSGGASAIDAFMAIRASETSSPDTLNCFADRDVQTIDGTPFRAVDLAGGSLGPIPQPFVANQSDFVRKHHAAMLAATWTRTSVNHSVGQARAVTGNDAWRGRTLQEAVALEYGEGFVLPNVHLVGGTGFTRRGTDPELPDRCRGEQVADPKLWPLSLDALTGVSGAPAREVLDAGRSLRQRLEGVSSAVRTFADSPLLQRWQHLRSGPTAALEAQGLLERLVVSADSERFPLSRHGIVPTAEAARLRSVFPALDHDPFEAQAALAFLLLKYRLSVTVTLGPSFNVAIADGLEIGDEESLPLGAIANPPIAFDFSHEAHRAVQAFMWSRLYSVMGRLIDLLAAEEWADGESLWDRTLMYVATDFGRTKTRPAGAPEFGTGHDLDNGLLVVSPLARGNTVLGGVDPATGLTYGFDPRTGAPEPGRRMQEREIYGGILQALGVDTSGSGLPDMAAMRKV